jgi:ABC-2 type transport system permease protein
MTIDSARFRRLRPLAELTRVRMLEFIREPEAVFWVFVFPVLLAVALGIAFRAKPVSSLEVAVAAEPAAASRLETLLHGAQGLRVHLMGKAEADHALRSGRVDVVVEASGLSRSLPEGVTYRYDPTRAEGRAAHLAVDAALEKALGRTDVLEAHEEWVSRHGSRYIDFLIPGLVGLNLMGSGLWGLGFAVVSARTRKLLKRFAVTPMYRSHYLLSFMLSRLLFMVLEVAAIVGFGWAAFGVRVNGSFAALGVVSLAGAMTFAGIGLLVAARPKTIEGVSGWMNLVMLPMWLLSGSFFSYERFPQIVQPAIRALPLTALNDALRLIINAGSSLTATWGQLAVMAGWGIVSFALALRIFRWT